MDVVLPLLEVWRSPFVKYECDKAPSRCVTCGLDTVKTGISCGGEYDPLKCMIKGYEPPRKVPEAYMEKMRNWATKNNVEFGKPSCDGGKPPSVERARRYAKAAGDDDRPDGRSCCAARRNSEGRCHERYAG